MEKKKRPITENNNDEALIHEIPKEDLENATMSRSRRKDVQTSKLKRNLILTSLGLIGLVAFLIIVGPQLLVQFSILVGDMRSGEEAVNTERELAELYIPPPTLDQPEKATKESKVTINGTGAAKQTIELYLNNKLVEKKTLTSESFTFSDISLDEGKNSFKAKAIIDKKESRFSEPVEVIYREKAPEIEIETPKDGDAFSGSVSVLKVRGKTAPYAKVTINEAWAIMDEEGVFRYDFRMQSGENKIKIKATDEAGNSTEKEVTFTYSP